MRKKFLLLISFVAMFAAWQLVQVKQVWADSKLKVVTTFYPVYEFTKNVVGDKADVSMLIKAGTEPHDFEPSTKNIATIQDSNAFVYMDDNMETWAPKVAKSVKSKKVTTIKGTGDMLLTKGVEEEGEEHEGHGHEGHHHELDPHVWLSPERAISVVENIRNKFVKAYPKDAASFNKNADAYIAKLKELDKEYKNGLSNAKQKSFVTQHAAFGYMALDYGLNQVPIAGLTPDAEPSSKRLGELAKYIKKYNINYIYFEENASNKVAKTLADEVGVKTAVLSPLEGLSKKEMAAGEDYFSVMRRNLKVLKKTTDVAGKEVAPEEDKTKTVETGYFKTKDVKDRKLTDYSGNWQSVYPLLQDGTLDPVWDYKAKSKKDMTAAEYKKYYTAGYKTDVESIKIDGKKHQMTFVRNGKSQTFTYKYAGYKILTYKKGNRGVRYLFEAKEKDAGQFKYIQFSDHGIKPNKAEHFHIFWGSESQEKLFEEMENWPTYFPAKMSGREVAQDLMSH